MHVVLLFVVSLMAWAGPDDEGFRRRGFKIQVQQVLLIKESRV